MPQPRILVADDEDNIRDLLKEALTSEGYQVSLAANGREAMALLDKQEFDVVLTDLKMPQSSGIDVLRHMKEKRMGGVGIVATAYGTIDTAIQALKLGALEYITKPFHLDEIRITIKKALNYRELEQENRKLKQQVRAESQFEDIVGDSPRMRQLFDLIRVVANDADSTVLIQGESGTGKELVARAIHFNSPRRNMPLIPVNCGALPETLLESELFGHVKGAFTGAHVDRVGRFQLADGGTIFLDEIGEMSPVLQVKVLRVLQEQEFEPVGSVNTVKVDVRIIAATNRDLEQMVAEKKFREDLFYRLNVIPIRLPALRERIDDIPRLINHFISVFNRQKGKQMQAFSDEALDCLARYNWQGNVRELENLVERMATIYGEGIIGLEQLPERFREGLGKAPRAGAPFEFTDNGIDLNQLVDEFETGLILEALARSKGVKNRAANLLNIKRTTLVEKMKKKASRDPSLFAEYE